MRRQARRNLLLGSHEDAKLQAGEYRRNRIGDGLDDTSAMSLRCISVKRTTVSSSCRLVVAADWLGYGPVALRNGVINIADGRENRLRAW